MARRISHGGQEKPNGEAPARRFRRLCAVRKLAQIDRLVFL